MTLDIITSVLSGAHDFGHVFGELSKRLRELTGAQAVILAHKPPAAAGAGDPLLLNVVPAGHWSVFDTRDGKRLVEIASALRQPDLCVPDHGGDELHGLFNRLELGVSLVLPLVVGEEPLGVILAVGLMDEGYAQTIMGMQTALALSGVLAIVLKNSLLIEEQKRATDAAEAANRSKSSFLANMSHEIRTPLNAILGYTQLMQRSAGLTPRQAEYLDTIARSGEHLLVLINDVLEMSKIESGRAMVNPSTFDLCRLLDDIELMFRARTDAKGLGLTFGCDPAVPRFVSTDESKLRQILVNLLGNALKFTRAGEIEVRVLPLSCGETTARLAIDVRDTGCGIPDDERERIFDQFEQSKTHVSHSGGTGLGLAISRRYARLMGGDITVQSETGAGSVFRVEFVVEVKERSDATGRLDKDVAQRVVGLAAGCTAPRMLVVDHEPDNRDMLCRMLSGIGLEVRDAVDGESALNVFRRWRPHVVLMEMRMPGLDGLQAMRRIKALPEAAGTAVVIVTASALDDDRARAIESGADGFVRKPFREGDVLEEIRRHTGVQYARGGPPVAGRRAPGPPVPGTADIARLPGRLAAELRGATEAGDMGMIMDLLQRVEEIDYAVGASLRELARRYDYDTLLDLLPGGDRAALHEETKGSGSVG